MNESLLVALLTADIEGDADAVQAILELSGDPEELAAAVQLEPSKGKKGGAAADTDPAGKFQL